MDPPPVPVIVAVPCVPPTAPEFVPEIMVITAELLLVKVVSLVTSLPFRVAVKLTVVPAGSLARLSVLPREELMTKLPC